ncbi:MAG: sulfatase-like hydrolase/transferase [Thermoanaerobaculales bacterium]|jgi:arylsulfatase A-like enzyme|nr:sulfatase-like hydrolase/transferase [Thermoanaerobaculales bacterium]
MRWVALAVVIGLAGCTAAEPPPSPPENLVILSIDTLRPDHLSLYGYHHPTSEHLDRLARRSAVFDQAITVHVTTAPAHATVLTGRWPADHGIVRNGLRLADGVTTLAEVFAARGWATGAFVSGWTLERHTGLDRGFEVYDDALDGPGAGARRAGGLTTDRAIGWLELQATGGRPFFLFLHLFEPHWPYDPPAADALRFLPGQYELATIGRPVHIERRLSVNRLDGLERREYVARYDGEIAVADRLLGRLLDALDRLGLARRTAVVVLSDHGETLVEREWAMDHGGRPYDEQARVPLVLHIPGDRSAGRRVADQVSLLDVAPTALELLGVDPPAGLPGRSLLALARGEAPSSGLGPAFVTAGCLPERVPHIEAPLRPHAVVRAVRLPGLKLVEYPLADGGWHPELFDLGADPGETVNLAPARPELVSGLHAELDRWQGQRRADLEATGFELDPGVAEALRALGYDGD